MDRQTNRFTEERPVQIKEVNMANQRIVAEDNYQTTLYISTHFSDPTIQIPQMGEIWLAKRKGVDWHLIHRQDTDSQTTPVTSLQPGDVRIEAPNDLYLNGNITNIRSGIVNVDGQTVNLNGTVVINDENLEELLVPQPVGPSNLLREDASPGQVITWDPFRNQYVPTDLPTDIVTSIADIVLAAPAATIDISSISSSFKHLKLMVHGRSSDAAPVNLQLRFNNDSTVGNYDWASFWVSPGGTSSLGSNSATLISTGSTSWSSAASTANKFSSAAISISDYSSTAGWKNLTADAQGDNAGDSVRTMWGGTWHSTAVINQITLLLSAGNFEIGSTATLYGYHN